MKTKEASPAKGPSRKELRLRRQSQPLEEADAQDALAYTALVLRTKFNPPFALAEVTRAWQRVVTEALQLSQEFSRIPAPDLKPPNHPGETSSSTKEEVDNPGASPEALAFWKTMGLAARSPRRPRIVFPPWNDISAGVLGVVRGALSNSVEPALRPFVPLPLTPSGVLKPEMASLLERLVVETKGFLDAIRNYDHTRGIRKVVPGATRRPPSPQNWAVACLVFHLRRSKERWTDNEVACLLNELTTSHQFNRDSVRDIRRSFRVRDVLRDARFEFPWRVNRAALFGTRPGVRPLRRTPMPESTPPVDRGKPPQSE